MERYEVLRMAVVTNSLNKVYREVEGKVVPVMGRNAFGKNALVKGVPVLHEVSAQDARYLKDQCGLKVQTKDTKDGERHFVASLLVEAPLKLNLGADEGKKGTESFSNMLGLWKPDARYEL
jgi:hypothetical protein